MTVRTRHNGPEVAGIAVAAIAAMMIGPSANGQTCVSTAAELDAVRGVLNGDFIQCADIDLSNYTMSPIGDASFPFTGTYDGQGYRITGFSHDGFPIQQNDVGLFGVADGATFTDITLDHVAVTGWNNVGGLVGRADACTITGCQILSEAGTSSAYGILSVGGLAGRTQSTLLQNCVSYANSECILRWSGSMIGHMHVGCTVQDSQTYGLAAGGDVVGGFSGNVHGSLVERCYAYGNVAGSRVCGGFTGWLQENFGPTLDLTIVRDCVAEGRVESFGEGQVSFYDPVNQRTVQTFAPSNGGFAGWVDDRSEVDACIATGDVAAPNPTFTHSGGLLGWVSEDCHIHHSVATGEVEFANTAGGLIGRAEKNSVIEHCVASGAVTTIWQGGGLVGAQDRCTIRFCDAYGNVHALGTPDSGDADPGRLMAASGGLVGYSFASTTLQFASVIEACSAHGDVTAGGQMTGGLVGLAWGCSITESYATGNVESNDKKIGGLVGAMIDRDNSNTPSKIVNSYATGTVSQINPDEGYMGFVGGLLGHLDSDDNLLSSVTNSYSVGLVIAPMAAPSVGGLIGGREPVATVTSSYWDVETSGKSVSDGGVGKTTAEMMMQATFVGWDFVNVWSIIEDSSYPFLQVH